MQILKMYTSFLYFFYNQCFVKKKCTKTAFDLFYYALLCSGGGNSACA